MRIPDWLLLVGVYGSILGGATFLTWFTVQLIDMWGIFRRRRFFSEDIQSALAIGPPTWLQVLDFAELRQLNRTDIGRVLRILIRDGLTGKVSGVQLHLAALEGYLAEHRASEPFDGMPNEIKIHLERLRELGAESESFLQPLTAQIRDLLTLKSREYSRQKLYTTGGFAVGLVGLVFAGFSYLHPPEAPLSQEKEAPSPAASAVGQ